MTVLNRGPENTNYLQPTKFSIIFPRISTVTYFCQAVNIPGVSCGVANQPTYFKDLPRPGIKPLFNEFNMQFVIDEQLWAFSIIKDWICGYSFPCSFIEYINLNRDSLTTSVSEHPQYSDAILIINSPNNNPILEVKFYNAFPVKLSDVSLDTSSSSDHIITATAIFQYHIYTIKRL